MTKEFRDPGDLTGPVTYLLPFLFALVVICGTEPPAAASAPDAEEYISHALPEPQSKFVSQNARILLYTKRYETILALLKTLTRECFSVFRDSRFSLFKTGWAGNTLVGGFRLPPLRHQSGPASDFGRFRTSLNALPNP